MIKARFYLLIAATLVRVSRRLNNTAHRLNTLTEKVNTLTGKFVDKAKARIAESKAKNG